MRSTISILLLGAAWASTLGVLAGCEDETTLSPAPFDAGDAGGEAGKPDATTADAPSGGDAADAADAAEGG